MSQYVEMLNKATSVKNIGILNHPTSTNVGMADMQLMDVFSVFDYGTMPMPDGAVLDNRTVAMMAGYNFELLKREGIPTHYIGMVDEHGSLSTATNLIKLRTPSSTMRVTYVNRVLPEFKNGQWDYSMFKHPKNNNHLHPIEFIMRNSLPESSSVWKRVERGEITLADLGLPADFKVGASIPESLGDVILDYSTKLQPSDEYMPGIKAMNLMGISQERFDAINNITRKINSLMTEYANSKGFKRPDGKIEYAVVLGDNGPVDIVVDAVCTWHEDRLIWGDSGVGISKQRIRNKIKDLNPGWYAEIERAKQQARDDGVEDFRTLMNSDIGYTSPSPEFFLAVSNLFRAGTNQWVDAPVFTVFDDAHNYSLEDSLNRAVEEFRKVA